MWRTFDRCHAGRERLRRRDDDFPMRRLTGIAIKLALVTAQRIGEVTGIALDELDLNDIAPCWTVPATRSKNRESNRVALLPLAIELIQEARGLCANESPWLFPSPKGERAIAAYRGLSSARPPPHGCNRHG